jgi:hypothetical protein
LAAALNQLRGERSYAELARAVRGRSKSPLPPSTISDLLNGKSVPLRDTLVTFLTACGLHDEEGRQPWLAAQERVRTAGLRRPAGAVRVRDPGRRGCR